MTYGGTLFAAYWAQHRLPAWLPTDGLLYFDDFAELRERAPTGQAYSQNEGATAAYTIATLGGRRCLYKAQTDNRMRVGLQLAADNYTWGCFVYDKLGTCTNQQVFNLLGDAGTDFLNFRDSSDRIGIGRYSGGATSARVRVTGKYTQGQWHLLLAWQGNAWWGIGFDGVLNVGSVQNAPSAIDFALALPATTYGVGIRNAFIYNRVLTQEEVEKIYTYGL
jgi:hypothetical protein